MSGSTAQLLQGRTAVVTGAARGIGYSIAEAYARHGASVALIDLDTDTTARAAHEIAESTGATTVAHALDVCDETATSEAAGAIEARLGVVDIVVPNAGILVLKPALDLSAADLERVIAVNLVGAFVTATSFVRRMVATGTPGQVVFTSSLFGTRGGAGNSAYSASKFAVLGLAQSMAAELAPAGIRVNAVCPGQVDSLMLDQLFADRAAATGSTAEHERAQFLHDIPMGGLGRPSEVADTYVYLACDLSSYVTGQHVVVDGGWSVG